MNSFMILAPSNAIPNIQRVNSPINPHQAQGQPTQQIQPTQLTQQIQWAGQNIQVLSGSGSSTGIQVVDLRDAQASFHFPKRLKKIFNFFFNDPIILKTAQGRPSSKTTSSSE